MFYPLLRPALFAADPEHAHRLAFAALDAAAKSGLAQLAAPRLPRDPARVMGIDFPNRVGLAAGLDKDAAHLPGLATLGFGFLEAGTVTPRAQPGNPKPRMFRLPQANALINRLGFNNGGVERFVANVRASGYRGILGCNIGKNADTPNERAIDDYLACLAAVAPVASYVTVNVTRARTPRDCATCSRRRRSARCSTGSSPSATGSCRRLGRALPLAVKIAPDLDADAIRGIARVLVASGVDAAIATNTTIARDAVAALPHGNEAGGLSGAPVREPSNVALARAGQGARRRAAGDRRRRHPVRRGRAREDRARRRAGAGLHRARLPRPGTGRRVRAGAGVGAVGVRSGSGYEPDPVPDLVAPRARDQHPPFRRRDDLAVLVHRGRRAA